MARYGDIAIAATKMAALHLVNPGDAWVKAAQAIYPDHVDLLENSCPKEAFLGLCENGNVKGIPQGKYTKSQSNKSCALKALLYLRWKASNIRLSPDELWGKLDIGVEHNEQMDVVLSLVGSGHLDV